MKRNSTSNWDYTKIKLLIKLVRKRPIIYDSNNPQFNDSAEKKLAWKEIGFELRDNVTDCQKNWRKLVQTFRKVRNGRQITQDDKLTKWKFGGFMHFMKKYLTDKNQTPVKDQKAIKEEVPDDDVKCIAEISSDQSVVQPEATEIIGNGTPPVQKVIPEQERIMPIESAHMHTVLQNSSNLLTQSRSEENVTSHPVDAFFALMAQSVKTFNSLDQHFVKTNIFSLVSELEGRYILQNQQISVLKNIS
ncbi:uncharacterized protein LOC122402612 [Colletes gigas]|uniref:uncharacterized protein LOC122402612 n=1 Tax=Colletes gigas TaxID=935657 RepID=UPI001C9A980E|nr:uncharacterized protein LOC122402612 [Colletes gigas]